MQSAWKVGSIRSPHIQGAGECISSWTSRGSVLVQGWAAGAGPPPSPTAAHMGQGVHGNRSCTPQVSKGPGPLSAQLFCVLCPGVSPAPAWHLFWLRGGGGGEESPGQGAAFVRTCPGGDGICLSNGPEPPPRPPGFGLSLVSCPADTPWRGSVAKRKKGRLDAGRQLADSAPECKARGHHLESKVWFAGEAGLKGVRAGFPPTSRMSR